MGKSGGISDSVKNSEAALADQTAASAKQVSAQGQQEFQAAFPGFQQAENYYQQLSTGDPSAISRAISPAVQQINAQSTASAQRIEQDSPRGGAKNLALEENQINKGAQVGNLATQSYLGSFGNLAGLAQQGVGESLGSTQTGISGLSSASGQYGNIAQQQAEGKASQLGFIGSLAGSGAEVAGAMCWIAVKLWGEYDRRTLVLRYYLNTQAQFHWFGRHLCRLYMKYGQGMAERMGRSHTLWVLFDWLFTRLYRRAERAVPHDMQCAIFDMVLGV